MSSKTKTTSTKEEAKPALVPKTHQKVPMQQLFPREGETQPRLRFPEFQNAGEWREGKLINLSSEPLSNGVFNDPKKVGSGYKLINVSDMYIETVIDESRLTLLELSPSDFEVNQVLKGDIFFTRSSLVKSGIAVSNIYLGSSNDVTYDGHLIRFRPSTSEVVPLFAHYLFKSAPIRAQLIARGKTATMTTIGQADVASVRLFYPGGAEQQKIAECLSSVDELMAAQARKVDALKTHKKGLMQQLFPREGETQPRLRFPEFQNAGDWEGQAVGDFGKVVTGCTPRTAQPAFYGGGISFVSPADISDLRFVDQTKTTLTPEGYAETRHIRAGSVLFVCIGSTIGKVAQNVRDCATNQQINAVVPSSKHSDGFVYFALSLASERIALLAGRQAVPIINKSLFSSVKVLAPNLPEQQRIATCLSSLDALITAATQKLEALKIHKKGLMQQLFPSPESIEA